ncbi:MAG: hypothetical protein ACXADB_00535 [Candidatus Hermodarchaeia archaeon]|jgi:hypothetical protein
MAATVVLAETNGAGAVETLDISNVNFGSNDSAELDPATYPITAKADGHSFEKWLRLYVSAMGGSVQLDNVKIWISNLGGGWKTGEGMSTNLRESGYVEASYPGGGPVDTDSTVATQVMPETEPTGANLGIEGALAGQITSAPSYTDFGVLQLDVTASTPAGAVNQKTLTFQYDEQ